MVTFENNQFIVIITASDPAEQWRETIRELIDLLYCQDESFIHRHPNVLLLINDMIPDADQARRLKGVLPCQQN